MFKVNLKTISMRFLFYMYKIKNVGWGVEKNNSEHKNNKIKSSGVDCVVSDPTFLIIPDKCTLDMKFTFPWLLSS